MTCARVATVRLTDPSDPYMDSYACAEHVESVRDVRQNIATEFERSSLSVMALEDES